MGIARSSPRPSTQPSGRRPDGDPGHARGRPAIRVDSAAGSPVGSGVAGANPLAGHAHDGATTWHGSRRSCSRGRGPADPYLTEVATHLIRAGRQAGPARLLPSRRPPPRCRSMPPATDAAVRGAVAVELVHLGSLYHDDVMDEAATRRTVDERQRPVGQPHRPSSPATSCSPGPRSSPPRSASRSPGCSPPPSGACARARSSSCSTPSTSTAPRRSTYRRSTARPRRCSRPRAASAASSPSSPATTSTPLDDFGHSYGMAFQLVDDVLDLVSDRRPSWASPRATTSRRASTRCR